MTGGWGCDEKGMQDLMRKDGNPMNRYKTEDGKGIDGK